MPRFMTAYVEYRYHGETPSEGFISSEIVAYAEDEDWRPAQEIAEDYVWQFAPDKETAKAQHFDKVDAWRADLDAGRPEKETY